VIGTLVSVPVVRSLLTGVLPGLALRIFVLLLPVLLYALNRRAGAVGQADMDGHVSQCPDVWSLSSARDGLRCCWLHPVFNSHERVCAFAACPCQVQQSSKDCLLG
jgi:hypothetical protein